MKTAGRNAVWMVTVLTSFLLGVAVNGAQDEERRAHYAVPFGIRPGILGWGPHVTFNSGINFQGVTFGSKEDKGFFSFHGERDEATKKCVDVYLGGTAKGTITLQNGEAHVVPDMTFPSESFEEAVALLQSTDFLDRARGAWVIGEIGDHRGITHIEQALNDPQNYVNKYARQSLLLLAKGKKGHWLGYSGTKKGSKMQVAVSFQYSPSSATIRKFSIEHSPVEGKGINIGWKPSNISAVDAEGNFTCSGRIAGFACGQVLADGSAVGTFSEQFKVTTEGDSGSAETETKWVAQIVGAAGSVTASSSGPPPAEIPQKQEHARTVLSTKPLPHYTDELVGNREVRVVNPNEFAVIAGIRSGKAGTNISIPAEGRRSAYVPDGQYDIYFVYSNKPDALFKGDDFTLDGNGVEIRIVKVVGGNYGIRQVK